MTTMSSKEAIAAAQYIEERDYWLKKLAEPPAKSIFPYDYTAKLPAGTGENNSTAAFKLSGELCAKLIKISSGSDYRLHVLLVAAVVLLIARYSGSNDIIVGTPVFKQKTKEKFINTVLVLRNRLHDRLTFKELILQAKQCIAEAAQHVNYPLETLLYHLKIPSTDEDFALFDIAILLRNIHDRDDIQHIDCNLIFSFLRTGDSIEGSLIYNTLRYRKTSIERILSHLQHLMRQALFNVDIQASSIEIVLEEEKRQILYQFNNTAEEAGYSIDKTFQSLFAEQVERHPDHIALVGQIPNPKSQIPNKGESFGQVLNAFGEMYLSYRELNEKANQLGHLLKEKGAKLDTIVGIVADRSIEMSIGILGILKAGGAYLPIDPDYPDDRINYMLKDSGTKILVTVPGLSEKFEKFSIVDCQLLMVNEIQLNRRRLNNPPQEANSINNYQLTIHNSQLNSSNLAYVIYTSGSTGKPKGVMIEHNGLANLKVFHETSYGLTGKDKIIQFSSGSFDASMWEICMALLNGAALHMVDKGTIADYERFAVFLEEKQITVVTLPPFYANRLNFHKLGALRLLITAGSPPTFALLNKCRKLKNMKYVNAYGPTEVTICATSWHFADIDKDSNAYSSIPIGKPLNNKYIYILDAHLRFLPIGIVGELYISGIGLARGYLNKPELTFEKFINYNVRNYKPNGINASMHPCNRASMQYHSYSPIYRTGDLARWLPDGNIEFLGRIDHQVKIRGFRIELGEIESHLLSYQGIKEVVAAAEIDEKGDKYLRAYIVSETELNLSEMREYLSAKLPDYMIPAYFVPLEKIPLTPNGKIDRKVLPEAEIKPGNQGDYIAPRNVTEQKLVEIWSEVLAIGKEKISIEANFFQLGGHSLKTTLMISKIYKELQTKVPLAEVFKTPNIKGLSEYIRAVRQDKYLSIEPAEEKEYYELSSAQKRLYIIQQMELESIVYNTPLALTLEGLLDKEKITDTFTQLIKRHESLRTSFHLAGDKPVQKVHEPVEFEIEYYDEKAAALISSFVRSFDLSQAPLMRVGLIREEDQKHILMIDMHHIVTDGVSMDLFVKETMALYSGEKLPSLRVRYRDYAQWQTSDRQKKAIKEQEEYWLRQLADEVPVLDMPFDYPRPVLQSFEGAVLSFEVPGELTSSINQMALDTGTTLYMVLLAIYNILLSKISGQEDIVVGTPIAARRHADLEPIIGMFVNTLVMRNYPRGNKKFADFLKELKKRTLEAFENQEYQFEDLVEKVSVNRDPGRNPIFDTLFGLQNMEGQTDGIPIVDISQLKISPYENEHHTAKFDLNLTCFENNEKLFCLFEYCTKLFKKETIERFFIYFKQILSAVLTDSNKKISQIEIITKEEKQQHLYDFNGTPARYPEHKTLHQLFAEQVERTPDNIALVGTHETHKKHEKKYNMSYLSYMSYKELNKKSNQLAYLLIEKGIKPDTIVGIMLERSVEMIVGILGILKAGGAYLPIDPDYPEERVQYMLADSAAKILLSQQEIAGLYPSTLLPFYPSNPLNLAYIIYTSGTTGRPRGVLIRQRNVVRLMVNDQFPFDFSSRDVWTLFHSYCFDFSVWEIFGALLNGSKLVIISKMTAMDTQNYLEILKWQQVTILNQTPSAFYHLMNLELEHSNKDLNIRYVIFGGEALNPRRLKEWHTRYPGTKLINMYGITETTVHVTFKEIGPVEMETVSSNIGKAIPTLSVYILEKYLGVLPVGITGELCVGGEGLGRGYLNQPESTKEKFVENPYEPGKMLYRSGDLARWNPPGELEYRGRIDHQVKIRGFRIEPGEIENRLLTDDRVKEAVVLVKKDKKGDKNLCAYIVAHMELLIPELKEFLLRFLPDYMVPSYIIQVQKIPLTPNGKVDREALPDPGTAWNQQGPLPPQNQLEKTLVDIWSEVLDLKQDLIGIDSDFFDLGGHSLKATSMIAKIHQKLQVKIPLVELFKTPKIRQLAEYIHRIDNIDNREDKYASIQPVDKKEYYPLSPTQKRMVILNELVSGSTGYNVYFTIPLTEKIEKKKLESAFRGIIARHDSMRTSFQVIDETPVQRIHKNVEFEIEYDRSLASGHQSLVNSHGRGEVSSPVKVEDVIRDFIRPFDLSRAPLLRVGLIEPMPGGVESVLIIDMHHIITDGTSNSILEKEFMALYTGEDLPPLRLQYKDFSEWLSRQEQKKWLEQQEVYWLKEFAHSPSVLNVPADFPRPLMQGFAGNIVTFKLNAEETKIIKTIARNNDLTLYMCLLAVFNILFSKLSGQEDITFGTPIAARRHADLQLIIGMLVNTLAMRNYPAADKTVRTFLKEVKKRTLEAYENQEYPFEELVENIFLSRDTSRNPVFDILLNLMNQSEWPSREWDSPDQPPYEHIKRTSSYDMGFSAVDAGENIHVHLEYSTNLYTPATIERYITYLKNIISSLPFNMEKRLADIEMLTREEKQQILRDLSRGINRPGQVNQTIHGWYEQKAAELPGKIALVFEHRHLTYRELDQQANQLALLLRQKGIGPNVIVGLMIDRSLEMIIAVLAVLKAGGAYLPIDPAYPNDRILFMMKDSGTPMVLTSESILKRSSVELLKKVNNYRPGIAPIVTPPRKPLHDLDSLPIPDRSLVNYKKYHQYIASAMAKHTVSILTSRGCPFRCIYCNKVFTGRYVSRSAGNIFAEIKNCYEAGIRRFAIIDDVFNLDEKNAAEVLNQLIKNRMEVQLFFSNGLRGDILTKEFIDLMIEAGTVTICLALESASPRIQKLIKKNLNLEKFRENVRYITQKYPQIIMEMELMHGFPTETEEEAMMTLDFLMELKWVHFPDLHILKIYPQTKMYQLAVNHGISEKQIARSVNLAYHQIPETLPFSKDFTRNYQARFLNEYFFLKERLQQVLPHQMNVLTEDELVWKYDSYLPMEIKCFPDILQSTGLSMEELGDAELLRDDHMDAPDFSREIARYFPKKKKRADAFRVLLLDLSLSVTAESTDMLYDVVEAPLGLMYLLTYLNEKFGERVCGKILKSKIDFDNFAGLRNLVMDFKPDLIGIRTLSLYKDFFHRSVLLIRQWGVDAPIVGGGPYATTEFTAMLQDVNVDMAVLGEGELTLADLIERMMNNGNRLPNDEVLKQVNGLAFIKKEDKSSLKQLNRNWIPLDNLDHRFYKQNGTHLNPINTNSDMAYVIYTSGSTGKPKGAVLEHRNLVNLFDFQFNYTNIDCTRMLQFATISFDASFHEIFSAFLSGGQLYLVDQETKADIRDLFNLIARHEIKTVFLPMSFLRLVFSEKDYINMIPRCIRHIQTAGEQVVINENFKQYLRDTGVYLHNHYGPSETHVVTTFTINPSGDVPGYPSIGRPILNTSIYILDKGMHLVPSRVTGELYIGGVQVGRGYLNNPGLTFERFINYKLQNTKYKQIPNYKIQITNKLAAKTREETLIKVPGKNGRQSCNHASMQPCIHAAMQPCSHTTMPSPHYLISPLSHFLIYRTGDLARWLPDGNIEFLGRIDHQVKIRGFRVELGEIESQLLKYPGIKESVVTAGIDGRGDKYLCAYIVSAGEPQTSELRQYLASALPEYMVPSYFVLLEKIPLSPTGKIDRSALPAPHMKKGKNYVPPRDNIEKVLVELWAELLAIEKNIISIDANFFELGGQSLKATVLIAKVHKNLHVRLPLAEVFKTPAIKGLAAYIKNTRKDKYASIEPVEKKEYYILSSPQKRLYILQQLDLQSPVYNIPEIIPLDLEQEPDRVKFEGAFKQLIRCHESLRTGFHLIEEEPVQRVRDDVEFAIEYYDAPVRSPKSTAALINSFIRPFDLAQVPLLRVGMIKTGDSRYLLLVDMHHIISDGISHQVLARDFMTLYNGKKLMPLRIHYKDFSEWQQRPDIKKSIKTQEDYWLKEFAAEIPVLNLLTDYPRPTVQSFKGSMKRFEISPGNTRRLKRLAFSDGCTLYMVLLAIFNILLSKLSEQEDIVIGTPIAGRRHADLEQVIGMFVNTLAMRNYPSGDKKFIGFLLELKVKTLDNFENQEYPFEDLVEWADARRDTSRNPIFDTMFALQNLETQTREISIVETSGIEAGPYENESPAHTAKFDLKLTGLEDGEKLLCFFEYCTQLFKKETIERFILYFNQVLSTVLENPGQKISQIEIITPAEKQQVLHDFNDTAAAYSEDKALHQLFAEQVERTPDHTALVGTHETHKKHEKKYNMSYLSYKELNKKSNQLAYYLVEKGVKPDTIVGIMVERSLELIVGIFGILKAGGAYLPIDPDYPEERKQYMLDDSAAKILLSQQEIAGPHPSTLLPFYPSNPLNLAYVIYTSGSTGKPKGVTVGHCSVINILSALDEAYPLRETYCCMLKTSFTFDVSVSELFGWFHSGGRLLVVGKDDHKNPQKIIDTIELSRVTHINFVPSMFGVFIDQLDHKNCRKLSSLKYIFLAGEALPPRQVERFNELNTGVVLENLYGPTECTIYVSAYSLSQWSGSGTIPIGKPLQNTKLYILGSNLCLAPIGVTGELCIAGVGVSRGYLNNPELTNSKFQITNKTAMQPYSYASMQYHSPSPQYPITPLPHFPIYLTGDLAKWLADGNIAFLGRLDQQVKIRGFRIELGEIESRLLKHPMVKEAVVMTGEDDKGDKRLCAYIVSHKEHPGSELREYLARYLPDYMIPLFFVPLKKIPLTTNGKVDRKALPEPGLKSSTDYIAPRNTTEEKLVEIWADLLSLGKEKISTHENFFNLGGHSLKATVMTVKVREKLRVQLPLVQVFKTPNIIGLAKYINQSCEEQMRPVNDDRLILLKKSRSDVEHLFLIHDGTGDVEGYGDFCNLLNTGINCWGIQADRMESFAPKNLTIEAIAENYLQKIKKLQPRGPYFIAGWSLGGTIVFEMVRLLEIMGEEIAFFALIDSPPPRDCFQEDLLPFTSAAEKDFIKNYIGDKELENKMEHVTDINDIWTLMIGYLESNRLKSEIIKKSIVENEDFVVPDYHQLGIGELIRYLNVGRTLHHARAAYIPIGQIKAAGHFFKASKPWFEHRSWNVYIKEALEFHEISGDHYSIFRDPHVVGFAKLFERVLEASISPRQAVSIKNKLLR